MQKIHLSYIIFIANGDSAPQNDKIFNNVQKDLDQRCGKRFLGENRNVIVDLS